MPDSWRWIFTDRSSFLYSICDGMESPQEAVEMLDQHVGQFAARMQKSQNNAASGQDSKS